MDSREQDKDMMPMATAPVVEAAAGSGTTLDPLALNKDTGNVLSGLKAIEQDMMPMASAPAVEAAAGSGTTLDPLALNKDTGNVLSGLKAIEQDMMPMSSAPAVEAAAGSGTTLDPLALNKDTGNVLSGLKAIEQDQIKQQRQRCKRMHYLKLVKIYKIHLATLPYQFLLNILNLILHICHFGFFFQESINKKRHDTNLQLNLCVWVVMAQVIYSAVAIFDQCRFYENMLKGPVSKRGMIAEVRYYTSRCAIFGVTWTLTIVMTAVYWPIYIYDPELIMEKTLRDTYFASPLCNHIMHTSTAIFIFLEGLFRPRMLPDYIRMRTELLVAVSLIFFHIILVTASYLLGDLLIYPVLALFDGNTFWYLLLTISGIFLTVLAYFLQWGLMLVSLWCCFPDM